MEAVLTHIADYLWTQSWQIALLVAAVALASWALRHRSAHVRYLLWLLVLAKCLAPPMVHVPLPVLPDQSPPTTALAAPTAPLDEGMTELPEPERLQPVSASPEPTPRPPTPMAPAGGALQLTTPQWLAVGWLAGATVFLGVALAKAARTMLWLRQERQSRPHTAGDSVDETFRSLRVKRPPRVWLIPGVGQPFVWGLLRGAIYLPQNFAQTGSEEHRRNILAHEISHVLRFDAAVNALQIFAQAIFWFHPLVWWANRNIRREREKCCDERAIAHLGAKPKDYSTAILDTLIQAQKSTRPVPSLAVAGPVKNIEERIRAMLRPGKKFHRRPSLVAATVTAIVALLTIPTALVLTVRAQTEAPRQQVKATYPLHEAALLEDNIEQVKVLLAKGVNISGKDDQGKTALHRACENGYREIAGLLITQGADINGRDKKGNTPLHLVSRSWNASKELLNLLIAMGADVNARNDDGQTPLHCASPASPAFEKERRINIVAANALVLNGAQIDAKDKRGCTPLYVASENGRRDIVELLLVKGAAINEKMHAGCAPLHVAAMAGRTETAKALVQWMGRGNSALDSRDRQGCTPLHYACLAGANDIVELLIRNDADVNPKNTREETPAHLAVVHNHKDTVRLLLSKSAGISSIHLAAYVGDLPKVKSFIEKGISVSAQDARSLTPLHAAAGAGQRESAEFLLGQGASVNAPAMTEGPGTPLHYAIDGGSKEVTELLINRGAIVDAKNESGETPLHLASKKGYSDLVQLLIANKADADAKAKNGLTPLAYAARLGHYAVVKFLIDKGATMSNIDDLLYCMCKYGYMDLAKLCIQKGANVNSEAWGYAPSFEALWNGRPDILRLLLDHGADPNARYRGDWTLLHWTVDAVCRSLEMTRMLLDKGANPNTKLRSGGASPFGWAAWYGLNETVELFLAKGANVNDKDHKGRTPLQYAKDRGYPETVELLRKHGATQ